MEREDRIGWTITFIIMAIIMYYGLTVLKGVDKLIQGTMERNTYECCAAVNMYDPPCIEFKAKGEPRDIKIHFNNAELNTICKERN